MLAAGADQPPAAACTLQARDLLLPPGAVFQPGSDGRRRFDHQPLPDPEAAPGRRLAEPGAGGLRRQPLQRTVVEERACGQRVEAAGVPRRRLELEDAPGDQGLGGFASIEGRSAGEGLSKELGRVPAPGIQAWRHQGRGIARGGRFGVFEHLGSQPFGAEGARQGRAGHARADDADAGRRRRSGSQRLAGRKRRLQPLRLAPESRVLGDREALGLKAAPHGAGDGEGG